MPPNYQVQRRGEALTARGHAEARKRRTRVARGRALYGRHVRCNAELGGTCNVDRRFASLAPYVPWISCVAEEASEKEAHCYPNDQ
jgi:hypothetical protein